MYVRELTARQTLILSSILLCGCGSDEAGSGAGMPGASGGANNAAGATPGASGESGASGVTGTGGIMMGGGGTTAEGDVAGMGGAAPADGDTGAGGMLGISGDAAVGGMTGVGGMDGGSAPIEYTREDCVLIEGATDGPTRTLNLRIEEVVSGVEIPWGLEWLPNGDLLFTERPGRLRLIQGGVLQPAPLIDVDVAEISFLEELGDLGSEGGLLGVLLHPDFETNRQFYMYWLARRASDDALINRLGLFVLAQDGSSAIFERLLLDDIPGGLHHQGGRMRIGPDGMLYVGVGAYDPSLAQQPGELPGKLLRLNLDGTTPDDNPTPNSPVFLTGIRNTQGFDWFDDHYLLVMDHGPTAIDPGVPEKGWDEFNVARAGQNLGWPDVLGCEMGAGITEPVLVWERSTPPGGAAIYRGTAIPEWNGSFIFATLGLPLFPEEGQALHQIKVSPDNPYVVEQHAVYLKGEYGRLRTVAMGPDGHLYVTTSNCDSRGMLNGRCSETGDQILRIVGGS